MLRFIFTRLSLIVPTFIGITLLVFVLVRLIPGDPISCQSVIVLSMLLLHSATGPVFRTRGIPSSCGVKEAIEPVVAST